MRYLGGKAKIAKQLARVVREHTDAVNLWEPFCGGLNATKALADVGFRVTATDTNPVLIALLSAWRDGWRPPPRDSITRDGHAAARQLSDNDPLKGFYGFALSFGGDYFCGFTGAEGTRPSDDYYGAACRALTRDSAAPAAIGLASFFDRKPAPAEGWAIYCDPPYAGTTGYATGDFDHERFWERVRGWGEAGVPVFVSEYSAPSDMREIACFDKACSVGNDNTKRRQDRLFVNKAVLL